jgi:hypothetical protein
MIPDLDIYRAAKLLIDQHGQDATIRAAERADELLEGGDTEGAAIWRAIAAAIEELRRGGTRATRSIDRLGSRIQAMT